MNTRVRFENMINTLQLHHFVFEERNPDFTYPKHNNRLFELFICREGEVVFTIHGKSVKLRSRDGVFIKPGIKHQFKNESGMPYSFFQLHFDIDDKELRELLSLVSFRHIQHNKEQGETLASLLTEIEKLLPSKTGAAEKRAQSVGAGGARDSFHVQTVQLAITNKLTLQAYVLLIIAQVTLLPVSEPGGDGASSLRRKDSTAYTIETAHAIEEQLNGLVFADVSIADIARRLNISGSQCSKIFRQVYGTSPRHYLSQLKLNMAKELLVKSDKSEQLGFSSINHFSRQFRRWTGISPARFRPKHTL
jgi:AraC family transcriptional regulator